MHKVYENILQAISDTPIIRLNKMAAGLPGNVFAKLEFLNPGASIKDRIALHIIEKAEREGKLKPGGTIVENTSGNTGAGLAIVAAVKGYKAIFTIPDKMSSEKINFLKAFGAKVVVTPTNVPADSPQSYYETAKRIAKNTPSSFYVNQYHNPDNPEAHYLSTGPEIWRQMDGKIDYLVAGIGTGGTLSGAAKYLKEQNPEIKVVAVDPVGSVFYDYFKTGKLPEPHVYKLEGIGEDMMVEAMDFDLVDEMYQVDDKQGFLNARRLARDEGVFAGGSSGAAVYGALKVAETAPKGANIVTILPDTGFRYLSKFYRDEWMRDNAFFESDGEGTVKEILADKKQHDVYSVSSHDSIKDVIAVMKQYNISQLAVIDEGAVTGLISESDILQSLFSHEKSVNDSIGDLVDTHVSIVNEDTPVEEIAGQLRKKNAVLVHNGNRVEIITRIDLIDFLSR